MPCPCQCHLGIVKVLRGYSQSEELLAGLDPGRSSHSLAESHSHAAGDTVSACTRGLLILTNDMVRISSELEVEVGPAHHLQKDNGWLQPLPPQERYA